MLVARLRTGQQTERPYRRSSFEESSERDFSNLNLNGWEENEQSVTMKHFQLILFAVCLAGGFSGKSQGKPLKVFILAGQSNMQGSAHYNTFAAIGDDPKTAPMLQEILNEERKPVEADNAWVTYLTGRGEERILRSGKVKVGYGFDEERIGPEYGFGLALDRALDEPVLLIKTAWGGKSLAVDFRPPSAGAYGPSEQEIERGQIPEGHLHRRDLFSCCAQSCRCHLTLDDWKALSPSNLDSHPRECHWRSDRRRCVQCDPPHQETW